MEGLEGIGFVICGIILFIGGGCRWNFIGICSIILIGVMGEFFRLIEYLEYGR